jgi:hypothetical protein
MRLERWLVAIAAAVVLAGVARAQGIGPSGAPPDGEPTEEAPAKPYRESALRRFEIITFVSLPFTAIHSYLVVRGVKMVREKNFAAGLEGKDWQAVGVGALTFSVAIGVYDWLRMRGKDRNAPLLPEPASPPSGRSPLSSVGGGVVVPALAVRF